MQILTINDDRTAGIADFTTKAIVMNSLVRELEVKQVIDLI